MPPAAIARLEGVARAQRTSVSHVIRESLGVADGGRALFGVPEELWGALGDLMVERHLSFGQLVALALRREARHQERRPRGEQDHQKRRRRP